MRRREYVTVAGGSLAVLAGCNGLDAGGGTGTSSPTTASGGAARPAADAALVIEERRAVEGTNVNVGAEGAATNAASTALADCVVHVTGVVGTRTYSGVALRERLAPGATWEWTVAFGPDADASDVDSVEALRVVTQAEYAE